MSGRRGSARVGCSGFSYRDWRGIVYPADMPQSRWLQHYATMFDTVELNNTFYRVPTAHAVEHWAASVPNDFMFAFKLGSFGTHRKKLRDPLSWLPKHIDRAERLGAKLGPTLVQLPPRWRRNAARLDEFLGLVPPTTRWAVEVRDSSWLHDEIFEVLRRHKVALCVHDLLADHPFVMTTDWTYIRFHGPNAISHPYRGAYGAHRLRPWADRLEHELDAGHDVYCYFNNDYDGHAVTDARWLHAALAPAATETRSVG
ncbi:MAG: hypothetical protein QOJ66_456 [Ilumatobacteraceae bacterium]